MRKELIVEGHRLVEVELHTSKHSCRMVERVMSASPEQPKKPFRGKNWYSARSKARYEREKQRMSEEHLNELKALALETSTDLYERLFGVNELISCSC